MNRMLLTRQIAFRQVVAIFAFALAAAPAGWAQSYPDKAKAGVFREGFFWLLDIDGNNAFNSPPDGYFPFGGLASDIPLSGNWNGDSRGSKVGLFRSDGSFVLDTNDDGLIDAGDATIRLGSGLGTTTGDVPVVGDWGGTGVTKVGIYRPSTGQWFLDLNGDGVFDAGDATYNFGGVADDKPVVGNWNGDSHGDKVGIFRQGYFWLLDYNGDGSFDTGDQAFAYGGVQGDVPITGDWTGTGVARVGIVRHYTPGGQPFFWILDVNNDHAIDSTNLTFTYGGLAGDVFLAGNWQPFPPATPTPGSVSINGGSSTGSGPPSTSQHTTLAFTFHDNLAGAANIREGYVQLMDVNNTAHCQIFWAPPASLSLDDTSGYCAGLTGSVTYPSSDYSAVVVTVSLAINLAPGTYGVLAQNYDWEGLSTPWSLVGAGP